MSKTITVDDDVWEQLSILKIEKKKETICDIIRELLHAKK